MLCGGSWVVVVVVVIVQRLRGRSAQPSLSELFVRGPLCCSPVEHSPMSSVPGTLLTVADEKRGLLVADAGRTAWLTG